MARLEVRLLGGFEVVLDGRPVTEFESVTTRALLARLAVDAGVPLPRRSLAEMLWPDRPDGRALANLRHALSVLRRAVGDPERVAPVLESGHDTLMFCLGPDVTVDVVDLRRLAETPLEAPGAATALEQAAAVHRGPFLEGFAGVSSEEWDTWLVTTRRELDVVVAGISERLADLRERTGEHARAMEHIRRWLSVDPWSEPAHGHLIRVLALAGQPGAAIEHAESFVRELDRELGVEPGPALRSIIDDVRAGNVAAHVPAVPGLPPRPARHRERCVARTRELAWLHERLDEAMGGAGGPAFVSGVAGAGKSLLVRAFALEARIRTPDLCVLHGACNAYAGRGDPLLPFRQVLGQLCGDLAPVWSHGLLTPREVSQLWEGVPAAVTAVLDAGPYLLGTMLDPEQLAQRLAADFPAHPLRPRLEAALEQAARRGDDPMRRRQPLLDQYVSVMTRLATRRPMLVIVDDLHWADADSIDLLRHLGTGIDGSPILVLGTYRPPDAELHAADPLGRTVTEAQVRSSVERVLELTGSREFVDAWLDTEPNLLDDAFRRRLFELTNGHALFTVELVAAMRQRGDLVVDRRGRWTAPATIAWGELSPRVEATIAARVSALPDEVRRELEVAAVVGQTFSADVVASLVQRPSADVARRLGELAQPSHALIEHAGIELIDERPVDRYRFRHALIRTFLEEGLSRPDRRALHEAAGRLLVERDAGHLDEIAVDLAFHFDAAGLVDEAIEYRTRAGQRAFRLSATTDAISNFRRALELARGSPPGPRRDSTQLGLLTMLGACLQAHAGYNAEETEATYRRLRELIGAVGPTFEAAQALGSLIAIDGLRGRYGDATTGSERLLAMADELSAPPIAAVAHMQLGWVDLMSGRLAEAVVHLDQAIGMYDEAWDEWLTPTVGFHVRSTALSWRAVAASVTGRFESARRDATRAIDDARRVGFPFGLAFALSVGGCLVAEQLGDAPAAIEYAADVAVIADREDLAFYRAAARLHRGIGSAILGERDGVDLMEEGLAAWADLGTRAFRSWIQSSRAEYLVAAGRLDDAAAAIAEVERELTDGEERIAIFFLPLARAGLSRAHGDDRTAEAVLRDAIGLQERHGARGPLLRAAIALAQLLLDQGRDREAAAALDTALPDRPAESVAPFVALARRMRDGIRC